MIQGKLELPDHVKGTTFRAITLNVLLGDSPPLESLDSCSIILEKEGGGSIEFPVVVTNPATWAISFSGSSELMDVDPGNYAGDIKTVDEVSEIQKYVRVFIKILPSPQ